MTITYYVFGAQGPWNVRAVSTLTGEPVSGIDDSLAILDGPAAGSLTWRGVASNVRYASRKELSDLRHVQESLGRPAASMAALIPIRKTEAWWALAQDERRDIFEEQSRHHSIGIRYLPEVARKLYHCRDLGEPFDFLTWFEFAPEHEGLFDRLVDELRASQEWTYVSREIDIRLRRPR